jgi:hypothetical protein
MNVNTLNTNYNIKCLPVKYSERTVRLASETAPVRIEACRALDAIICVQAKVDYYYFRCVMLKETTLQAID